jgi:cytochrome c peroxidase
MRRVGTLFVVAAFACGNSSAQSAGDAGADAAHPLCVDGQSVDGQYPKAAYGFDSYGTAPDLTFVGESGPVSLHEYFEPCAAQSRLLVVRVSAAWCGTCQWQLKHTQDVKKLDIGARLEWLDLLVANRDNDPATVVDLADFRKQIDAPEKLAVDTAFSFGPVLRGTTAPLPLIVFIDTRTMTIRNRVTDPAPWELETRIRQELAILDGQPLPDAVASQKYDNLFYQNQWDLLHDMTVPGAPPPDPTNAKADDPGSAALGKQLFSEKALSPSASVSCASCHDPAKQLQDGLAQSTGGVATVDRNAPTLALAAHNRWQFWDGRADTLWMQALGPFENAKEFASSRLFVMHQVYSLYKSPFEAVFGPLPALSDMTRFPPSGKPGDASWNGMAAADQKAVTDAFVNVGKAIAAFERTLRIKANRLDQYIGGDLGALSVQEKDGLYAFMVVGCAQCHYGPRLTDDSFHPDRYPTGRQDGQADRGRIDGVTQLLVSEFAQSHPGVASRPTQLGSFKTPTLRGIAGSAPYGHGGTLATLDDVTKNYGKAGLDAADPKAIGTVEPWLVKFDATVQTTLVPFLQVLTADPIIP